MFTGIVTGIGEIISLNRNHGMQITIQTASLPEKPLLGQSIACSGICLTVVEGNIDTSLHKTSFVVDLSPETITRTTAQYWQVGTLVNLEKALCVGDELGGHWVTGHVDQMLRITHISATENAYKVCFAIEPALSKFIAPKGSVTIDGVSLTVNEVTDTELSVMIIPYTWQHTLFCHYQVGTQVNFEIDTIARYLARLIGR